MEIYYIRVVLPQAILMLSQNEFMVTRNTWDMGQHGAMPC